MTTPQQPGDDLKVEAEVIQDLDVTDDDADGIVGGSGGLKCKTVTQKMPE